jgi:AcrR family transcriptional regulator
MGRPRSTLLSRQIIGSAALRLVAKHGDFTIPGLAAALRVNPSSLYHHLPGGRLAIVHQMREQLYAQIDLAPFHDSAVPAADRLRRWMRVYRSATAAVPAAVPVLVGSQVEDTRTLEIYEALFLILKDAGVPAPARVTVSAMIDAVVLGSAIDAASPVPLWKLDGHSLPELSAVAASDDIHRAEAGFELAITAVLAAVERVARERRDEQAVQ